MPDIPQEVRETIKFNFVSTIDEVMQIALAAPKKSASKPPKGGRAKASG
jgi:hypothetical protein